MHPSRNHLFVPDGTTMAITLGDGCPTSATHHLTSSEVARASQVLARAFRNDPLVSFLLPDATGRERYLDRFYRCFLRYGLLYGELQAPSPNLEGLAMWLPPGEIQGAIPKMVRAGAFLLPFTVGPRYVIRSWMYSEHIRLLRHRDTPFPHWYLQLLGVNPEYQKQGHATRLLRSMFPNALIEKRCRAVWILRTGRTSSSMSDWGFGWLRKAICYGGTSIAG